MIRTDTNQMEAGAAELKRIMTQVKYCQDRCSTVRTRLRRFGSTHEAAAERLWTETRTMENLSDALRKYSSTLEKAADLYEEYERRNLERGQNQPENAWQNGPKYGVDAGPGLRPIERAWIQVTRPVGPGIIPWIRPRLRIRFPRIIRPPYIVPVLPGVVIYISPRYLIRRLRWPRLPIPWLVRPIIRVYRPIDLVLTYKRMMANWRSSL